MLGVVTHMHHLRRTASDGVEGGPEQRRVGLADPQHLGAEAEVEVAVEPQAADVGVAIGEGAEAVTPRQQFEHLQRIGVVTHLVARLQELLEGGFGNLLCALGVEAQIAQRRCDDPPPQLADPMDQRRLRRQQQRALLAQDARAQCVAERGQLLLQSALHGRFGLDQHRRALPQGVVEVEGDQLQPGRRHGTLLPRRRARGWAAS